MSLTPPLALTMGEPAGIGPELALKAWLQRRDEKLSPFFLIADPAQMDRLSAELDLAVEVKSIDSPGQAPEVYENALPVLPLTLSASAVPGHLDTANASAVLQSIEQAVRLTEKGEAGAVVTNPIHKKVLYDAGFKHPGHTEYLAELAGDVTPVMMLASDLLKVVPVTIHQSLSQAIETLSAEKIRQTIEITSASLKKSFGLNAPRLAVSGLNPHAGEDGSMGREEIEMIAPLLEELRREGHRIAGPLAADSMFHKAARDSYDAAICMYHDQALIPIKTLAFDSGVNVTLGLPFIRTSPDHGTALDIAGKGVARPGSLCAALRLAAQMTEAQSSAGTKDTA
ncbi:4-hydroxythreonine-4-phosphate dehydrogenase PdxA [Rhodovibrionaceae bacterium A322]